MKSNSGICFALDKTTGPSTVTCEVTRKKNCKHIILKIIHGKVCVSAPLYTSNSEIERFVSLKRAWIAKQLAKTTNTLSDFCTNQTILLFGEQYALQVRRVPRKTIKIVRTDALIEIFTPMEANEEQIKKKFKQFLKQEALGYFESCLLDLRTRSDIYPIIDRFLVNWRVRFMKSAFGLCYATRNEIVLNTELVMYDRKYVNYVILHELSHFYFQNHSKDFYQLFESLEPNWKNYKKELNALHKQHGGWAYI